jgi:hypothetical protein
MFYETLWINLQVGLSGPKIEYPAQLNFLKFYK